ncbi:alpha/beta hydrolase [Streptomyces purpureus]|uniref:alpha/beta hydrolase n=1 Tax=Streptomyces purpureus TaxID=1951 RepID=UPI0003728E43|nr:alpha/beta hydrolase [Streptomyces purpureus]
MSAKASLLRTALNATSLVAPRLAGRATFAVFTRPPGRARLRPDERGLLAEARTSLLTVNGKEVVTYAWGDGARPVLLVHGWQSRASRLSAFVTALRERGYSPVAFDAPAHGESDGATTTIIEFRDIIRQLHERHAAATGFEAVVAHSLGVLASLFALQGGVSTRRFVGIGGVADFDFVIDSFCAGLGLRERIRGALRGRIENALFPGDPGTWARFSAAYRPHELAAPVLLFHDESDDMVPAAQSRLLETAHRGRVRLVRTQGLGHRRILADPAVVTETVGFVTAAVDTETVTSRPGRSPVVPRS